MEKNKINEQLSKQENDKKNNKIKKLYNFLAIIVAVCTIGLLYISFKTKKENQEFFNKIGQTIFLQKEIQKNPELKEKIIKINKIIKENNIRLEGVSVIEIAKLLNDNLIDVMEKNLKNVRLIRQGKYITIKENGKNLLSYLIFIKEKNKEKPVKGIEPPKWSQIKIDLK